MLKRRFPVEFLKGALGFGLAILLIAPVAVLWSAGQDPTQVKPRDPVEKYSLQPGQVPGERYPQWAIQDEVAWKQKQAKPMYPRPADNWDEAKLGKGRFGDVPFVELDDDDTLMLPNNKGSFHTHGPKPEVAAALKKDLRGPARAKGDYYIAQLSPSAISGKKNDEVRSIFTNLGQVDILDYIPNNAYLVRVKGNAKQALLNSKSFSYVDAYHPAFKIHPEVGRASLRSPQQASDPTLKMRVDLHQGEASTDVRQAIEDLGGRVLAEMTAVDHVVLSVELDRNHLAELAGLDAVKGVREIRGQQSNAIVTSIQDEVGRLLDPRSNNGFVRPFYAEGIDGGGLYVDDPNDIPGCTPFNPVSGVVNPACYIIPPVYVGEVDNGISLDASPLAYNTTQGCAPPSGNCSGLPSSGGGQTNRKLEAYMLSKDFDNNGVLNDPTAEGDTLSCDAINSGGDTHGQIVAATMLGNPTGGQFGLGFKFEDLDQSNQFASYFNDTNEFGLDMDGQAPGARLLFIDAMGNGVSVNGPPPCATNLLSDVNTGALVVDDVQALACRNDLAGSTAEDCISSTNDPNEPWFTRGARDIVLPFGAPTDMDDNIINGHGTYGPPGDAYDIDNFLFLHRRVTVTVPVGNDGADQTGADIDPFAPRGDPNDTFTADDIQIQDLATGKNIVSVGSNITDTLQRGLTATDPTEFANNFTSKGPATFNSRRVAPLLMAPGFEAAKGGGGREGEYTDDYWDSHAVIVSFDNDQDSGGTLSQVRNQKKSGTSFSAAKVTGVAAQIRDYFAKGYYPEGVRNLSAPKLDVSGALVKAVLSASADFLQSGPLIASCQNKFCQSEQGYGKVELANVLPLKSYPVKRLPSDTSPLSNQPDVPNNIVVMDELFDGGKGYGVVALGGSKEVKFQVTHGGASVRAALAWYDAPGDTLINDLNLEVIDGDYDFTPAYNTSALAALGTGGPDPECTAVIAGAGACNWPANRCDTAVGAGYDYTGYGCGYCKISALPNPDAAWFDPTAGNPYVRRYLGNRFVDRQQFSKKADCDAGTGALDTGSPNSVPDVRNTTEMVYLYHTTDGSNIIFVAANQGTGSEGPYKAVVSWPDSGTGREKAAPNTPCVFDVAGDGIDGAVGATDRSLRTRDNRAYIGSGVDDPNTVGTDEAACNSIAAGDDVQVCPNLGKCQPFGLVVTGPLDLGVGKAQVELDKQGYDCSDTSLRMTVTEDEPSGATITAKITAGSRIEVLNAAGAIVDSEAGIGFNPISTAAATFRVWRRMGNVSNPVRVQYIADLGRGPISNNGILEVLDGQTIRAVYQDPDAGDAAAVATSRVNCQPLIGTGFIGLAIENFKQHVIAGGCDRGRAATLRGDFNLDAKERLQYSIYFTNHSSAEFVDLKATLTCINPAGTTQNPCSFVTIEDPVQHVGRIPFGWNGAALFNIKMASDLSSLTTANRVIELKTTFTANNTDSGGTIGTQSFTHRAALQADNQRLFYGSDFPGGGLAVIDWNKNGQIELAELNNGGTREEIEVRTYQTWAGTRNNDLISTSLDPNGTCGTAGCAPFNFDNNNGSFTTRLSGDSKPGAGFPTANQGWGYSTSGACGWQSRAGVNKGTWHAGQTNLLGSGTCGSYAIPSDTNTLPLNEFTNHLLTSPIFEKVNQGTDARGFTFDARMEMLAFNSNEQISDSRVTTTIEIDTNIDNDGPSILGDSFTYRAPYAISSARTNFAQTARRFGPLFTNGTADPNDDFGVSAPLATYDAGDFRQRPFLAYPAVDADPNTTGFQSDVSLCGGLSCRPGGFTTPAGPVRNRLIDTGATFEDFNGASGNRYQFQFNWLVREGGTANTGWTIDDVVFEWSEQHPADTQTFTGGDCSLNNTSLPFQGTCNVNTCVGGPRNGLFCRSGRNDDCRTVAVEGTCTSSVCTTGRVGLACTDQNDCDLGSCVAGNTALGCGVEADCNLNTNDCDAIPFRVSQTTPTGASSLARQCATINFEKLFSYDCTSGWEVSVQDDTPSVSGIAVAGVCTAGFCSAGKANTHTCSINANCDVRQVTVTARSGQEPLGENFKLNESLTIDGLFTGQVSASAINDQPGILFLDSDPGQRFTLIVSYPDPECDLDGDAQLGESNFTDLDGDGVMNFGGDGVLKDQDPIKKYCSLTTPTIPCFPGAPVSDDDNCFDNLTTTDVVNPVSTPQMDNNGDGLINASDCVIDPNHNRSNQCDFDNDGIGDICDNCPLRSNSDQLDTDADGVGNECEDNDIDHDGVRNVLDNCPTIYNPGQASTAAGKGGGSRFNKGIYCDDQPPANADFDGDGFTNLSDNCPNENAAEGVTPPTAAETYNPDQTDSDGDGIGDDCDSEDYDSDQVVNNLDLCPNIYNPADPSFQFQTDSDGDAQGDDRNGKDSVGRCTGGPTPNKQCLPVNTGAGCGAGGFCTQFSDAYCDPDSKDDNSNGVPDDLTQFTTELDCNFASGAFGAKVSEVAAVGLSAALLSDDGTADFVCVSGDPDPNNLILTEDCPDHNPANRAAAVGVTGTAADLSCQTPGSPVPTPNCEPVADGTADPKEVVSVRVTLSNQTLTSTNAPRTLTNATIGLRANTNQIGCVTRGQVFVGTFAGGGSITTPANGLQFILSPTTGQSTPERFAEVNMTVTVLADGVEANSPDMTFTAGADRDLILFPPLTNGCTGGALVGHNQAGVLCEDFDTERDGVAGYEFTRLFPSSDPNDPLRGVPDPNDDVLGHAVDGGPVPFGVDGRGPCSSDPGAAPALTCHVVPTENDWHLHSAFEPCGSTYDNIGLFPSSCAPEPRAHSGFRSMHMGRHLNASDTLYDTYRFRQTSAFVMDPFQVGDSSTLNFWHVIQVCDDKCVNAGAGGTCAGGQVHISLLDNATNKYEKWRRLAPTVNGYNSVDQEVIIICEFDPGDDQLPPLDETMCGSQPQWSDLGDVYGSDRTCVTDQDGSDPVDKDCGETTNRTALGTCSWVTDPNCGSFLENGSQGRGVWARSTFNLSSFLGRQARLRWVFEGGGGWGFGTSRSFIEPSSGSPYFAYDQDDGWYIDDIKITDARSQKGNIAPDPDDGLTACPSQGDTNNCGTITINVTGSAVDATAGDTVLFAQNANVGAQVLLDARQSVADAGSGCRSGMLEYRFVELSGHLGSVVSVLQDYSPDATASTAVMGDATYRIDARCSSDLGCTASKEVSVLAYTGDAVDIGTEVASYSPLGILDGVFIDHDRTTDTATLSWRSRPQPPGMAGYDLFRRTSTGIGAVALNGAGDPFATDKFQGTCLTNAIAATAVGTRTTTTNVATTLPTGQAWLYMVGHSSNNTLAIAPLGRRPSTSNRAGVLTSANVTCP